MSTLFTPLTALQSYTGVAVCPAPMARRGFGAAHDPDWQPQALRLRFSVKQIQRDQSQRTLAPAANPKPV